MCLQVFFLFVPSIVLPGVGALFLSLLSLSLSLLLVAFGGVGGFGLDGLWVLRERFQIPY
jgi:hypothetical protein